MWSSYIVGASIAGLARAVEQRGLMPDVIELKPDAPVLQRLLRQLM